MLTRIVIILILVTSIESLRIVSSSSIGNNNSVPLMTRIIFGHVVSPHGPSQLARNKMWLGWYRAYVRWCFQMKAGRRCKENDCCLWHMQCMVDFKEHYTGGWKEPKKTYKVDIDANWPYGIFGTGLYQERIAYGASDQKSMYYRLEAASTIFGNAMTQQNPNCACAEDTTLLDLVFSMCAQHIPGEKGTTRLPRKQFERDIPEESRGRSVIAKYFSKSTIRKIMEAFAAFSSIAVITSSLAVCRCYYRKSNSNNNSSTRVSNILRCRNKRQHQPIDPINVLSGKSTQSKKYYPSQKMKSKGKSTVVSNAKLNQNGSKDATNSKNRIREHQDIQIENWRENQFRTAVIIKRKVPVQWAMCPTCDCDFETKTGVMCKLQKKSVIGDINDIRYFCSNECLRRRFAAEY